jgi:hypothetical protein
MHRVNHLDSESSKSKWKSSELEASFEYSDPEDSDSNGLPKPVREWTCIAGDDIKGGELQSLPVPRREWTEVEASKQLELSVLSPRAKVLRQAASGRSLLGRVDGKEKGVGGPILQEIVQGPVNGHVEADLVVPVEAGDEQQVGAMPGERGSESLQTLDNTSNQWYSGGGGSMLVPSYKRFGSFQAP